MKLVLIAAAAVTVCLTTSSSAAMLSEALRATCPAKRLDWLNPGILTDGIDDFRSQLSPGGRARVEVLAQSALRRCDAGAGCVNAAYIGAVRRAGRFAELVGTLCLLPYRCTAPFVCNRS